MDVKVNLPKEKEIPDELQQYRPLDLVDHAIRIAYNQGINAWEGWYGHMANALDAQPGEDLIERARALTLAYKEFGEMGSDFQEAQKILARLRVVMQASDNDDLVNVAKKWAAEADKRTEANEELRALQLERNKWFLAAEKAAKERDHAVEGLRATIEGLRRQNSELKTTIEAQRQTIADLIRDSKSR